MPLLREGKQVSHRQLQQDRGDLPMNLYGGRGFQRALLLFLKVQRKRFHQ
jgi:hypothetical protein